MIEVSVVIPTYNRGSLLGRCLESLVAQDLGRDRFEVIVVSDGSSDDTVAIASNFARDHRLDLKVIGGEHRGAGHARNLGLAAAIAAIVAFTDDDVSVDPTWLREGLLAFADPGVAGVEGETVGEHDPGALFRSNIENREGGRYPTCNMFYRRETLVAVGGFDIRFARAREDSDLAFRVLDRGQRIVFCPRARVVHHNHRQSLRHPWFVASTLPDSVLLWSKHPGRDQLRARFYRSDAIEIGLVVVAAAAVIAGNWTTALVASAVCFTLVVRALVGEVMVERVGSPPRAVGLLVVYLCLPFVHLYYLALGYSRVRRGQGTTSPPA